MAEGLGAAPWPDAPPRSEGATVKGVDSGVLRLLLEGDPQSKELLRQWRGVEIATTEATMLGLSADALDAPARLHASRRTALERLRRKITVLPIDRRAVTEASRRLTRPSRGAELLRLAEWGAFEASGCEEVFTFSPPPPGKWRVRVAKVTRTKPKKPK